VYFEEKKDYAAAEICYKSALDALEEERQIQKYRHLEECPQMTQHEPITTSPLKLTAQDNSITP
jgi:hypothetical protein